MIITGSFFLVLHSSSSRIAATLEYPKHMIFMVNNKTKTIQELTLYAPS